MAFYHDSPPLFGTGSRGFGTTWGGTTDRTHGRDFDPVSPEHQAHAGRGPKGYRRSDERIHEDVCVLLTDHPEIDASDIEVTVKEGEVTLTGTVDARYSKRLAEDVAESVPGVRDVHNQLRVGQPAGQ